MSKYEKHLGLEEFNAAKEHFYTIISRLSSKETANAQHGDVEDLIWVEGFELLRLLLQGHLDLRAHQECRQESVKGSDDIVRTHCRPDCTRNLESLFGEVVVTRKGYSLADYRTVFPLDAALNLPEDKYSHGLRKLIGDEVAKNAFDEVVATLRKLTAGAVPKRQVEELTPKITVDFEAFYTKRSLQASEQTEDLLIMSTDGKGVVMREEDLREATRKAAERKRKSGKKQTRLKPGEKPNHKRMSTVAAVYTVSPNMRTAEDVMGTLCQEEQEKAKRISRPRAENKRVWASLERDPEEVIEEMFTEATRRDPEHGRKWVIVIDGAEHQLDVVKWYVNHYQVEVTVILDFVHVLEYLWDAAHGFYKVGSDAAEDWVCEKALEILHGNVSQVAAGMRRKATKLGLSTKKRKPIDKCAKYILKYKAYLRYDEYLSYGMPIATGVIEGACRYLVKDRMEITGARWGLKDAEAVLKLRALRTSGDFDEYWDFHRAEEFKRHHRSRYARYPLLKAVA